ncbi:putative NlpC/P60-like cell-wall peptidase [Apodospora peruviana]|uniref:NlpC/P60-like cell-wall peptidase n=1 Tax=Apodospora peruviana TaxID=516989 RepID=A0AAE0IUD6_9PEZI|nr:putative NlpC/P60-like cell-wall peptidase [Apodospora peruviana]
MKSFLIFALSLAGGLGAAQNITERSTVNGACNGSGGAPGVCIDTKACSADGGSFISDACPGTPDNIKCCTKTKCGSGGNCRFTSSCDGTTKTGLCPGPDNFKCCEPKGTPKPPVTGLPKKVLDKAMEAKGIPYNFGGGSCSGPTGNPKGFDCSGLVSWAVCKVTGRNLFSENLRVTRDMYCASEAKRKYKKVAFSNRQLGDAVFFGGYNCDCADHRDSIHHVGLMMDSGWRMWNALKTGTKVREDSFKGWSGNNKPCPYVIRFA